MPSHLLNKNKKDVLTPTERAPRHADGGAAGDDPSFTPTSDQLCLAIDRLHKQMVMSVLQSKKQMHTIYADVIEFGLDNMKLGFTDLEWGEIEDYYEAVSSMVNQLEGSPLPTFPT